MLNRFIQRIRIEKAASRLINNPKETITEIALDCGFSGSAVFSRAFKEVYNTTPSQWRQRAISGDDVVFGSKNKIRQTKRKIRQDMDTSTFYINPITNALPWRFTMKGKDPVRIEVKERTEQTVAYVRHIGPYKGDTKLFETLFQTLMTWAGPRGLLQFPETQMLAVYHDNPDITDEDKL
jgi:AraC family transcriptional regulator